MTASRINCTLKQWKEIYNKQMNYSPDLRNVERILQAKKMILELEKMLFELNN